MTFSGLLRRNVLLLSACQALMLSGSSLIVATSALIGLSLAENKLWATVPIGCLYFGTLVSTFPASILMKRIGRRKGFMWGPVFGLLGALTAIIAMIYQNFLLFAIGSFLVGMLNGVGHYYRFAAADISNDGYRSRAISWVLAGGVLAAFIGPNLASANRDLIAGFPFVGSYASLLVIYALSMALASRLQIQTPPKSERYGHQRPLREIVQQPQFLVAIFSAMVAYGVMNLLMTSTPLAMAGCGHSFADTAIVIEWHLLAMYAPSFFTGNLIIRYGTIRVMGVGALVLFSSIAVNISGTSVPHFVASLILVGIGWNFLFVGATSLVTESYSSSEKAKTQGLNDFIIFSTVAFTAITSGIIHELAGWKMLNMMVLPAIALALGAILWLGFRRAQGRQEKTV